VTSGDGKMSVDLVTAGVETALCVIARTK